MESSFYNDEELSKLGLKSYGKNVLISKKSSIYAPEKVCLGNNVRIDDFCILSGNIEIGNYVHISAYSVLYGKYGIKFEDYTGCSARSTIYSETDDFSGNYMIGATLPDDKINIIKGKVILKKYSQLGANTVVMPGVIVNEGAVTGALTFVNKDLDEWTINVGIPAKKLKDRNRNIKGIEI